ncbi:MAG TPA: M20/M25/M40 family metallo-hydrolase [Candidatus Dormibacteraeota bacterium]|jgi:acetylornithine deacetylase/succinyl-diaminopimelate desuccinylase-like protein
MADFAAIDRHISEHQGEWIAELGELCAVPSVSARHEGIEPCAALVARMLEKRGFAVEVSPTGGHPVVLGHAGGTNRSRTLLFYNHYDVQPPEPLELWESPPFNLTERDGAVFARGSKDDKGEFVCRLAALDAVRAVTGSYPCDVTWLAEGEEEIGSPNLPAWVEQNATRLRADAAVWEEGGIEVDETPIVRLGARGLLYVELSVKVLSRDAHSGQANLLPNAAWRLVWALASLKASDERILIPGFYDNVRPPSAREEELLRAMPPGAADIREEFGLHGLLGGVTDVSRAYFSPTANIAGIGAGYQGEGSKTVIPARASAKVDFRLVPDQDPHDISAKLRRHLDAVGFGAVAIEVLGAERPGITDPDAAVVRLNGEIGAEIYGKEPNIAPLSGGTTPMYLFTERGVPVVAPGVGWGAMNRAHSPNEFMRLKDFDRAAKHIARLAVRFAELA